MANIKKAGALRDVLRKLEQQPGQDQAAVSELQALLYGAGWHTVNKA